MIWFLTNIVGSANRVVVVEHPVAYLRGNFLASSNAFLLSFLILGPGIPLDLFGLRDALAANLPAACWGLAAALPAIYFVHSLSLHLMAR